jgi:hypothetical protein
MSTATTLINMTMEDGILKSVETLKSDAEPKQKVIFLAKQKEQILEQLKAVNEQLEAALNETGVGTMMQDPETLLVYKVVKPKGTFISYKEIDYVRTKKEDEDRGDLSVKEAKAAGFVLTKETAT